ncbi:hypothetical protein NSQ43_07225 [Sporosarcina sp. FSL W8-0480]
MFLAQAPSLNAEKLDVTMDTVDYSTGEVFGTVNYPEAFEDME